MRSEFSANVLLEANRQLAISHRAVIGEQAFTKREPLRAKLGKIRTRQLPSAPILPAKFVAW